ncbi:NAD-binding protein [Microbacterium limosum]|uniref:NAD-binding protein n=1 Tax=Microbacterium limosum TaxID=3079935 RepID=A0AAU0MHR3_9MICO|nr:NAD-binding protein [Microbacterium sp. Y20]WOQ70071.1 NAD-binding protein [Microbacterium sp. Y20]
MGSAPRSAPDSPLNGVFPLHRAADALRIRDHVAGDFAGRSVTVLGAGLIGTEAASFFVAAGAEVHLVARSDLPLVATLGIPIATRLRDLHREHTTFHGGRAVTSLRRASNGGVEVRLDRHHMGVRPRRHLSRHDTGDGVGISGKHRRHRRRQVASS